MAEYREPQEPERFKKEGWRYEYAQTYDQLQAEIARCLLYRQLTEIQDACLDCDSHLECFPMDEETAQFISSEKNSEAT